MFQILQQNDKFIVRFWQSFFLFDSLSKHHIDQYFNYFLLNDYKKMGYYEFTLNLYFTFWPVKIRHEVIKATSSAPTVLVCLIPCMYWCWLCVQDGPCNKSVKTLITIRDSTPSAVIAFSIVPLVNGYISFTCRQICIDFHYLDKQE